MKHFIKMMISSALCFLSFAFSGFLYAQQTPTLVRSWTFNVAGHLPLQRNYGEFLTQVERENLPDFIGCQEALSRTNTPLLEALNIKAKVNQYAILRGAQRGGPGQTSPDELCSIIYNKNKWIKLTPPNALVEALLTKAQFQLFDTWMLNQISANHQQTLLNKLINQKIDTFQLTWRANRAVNNIGGAYEDRKNQFGPFSRIATWAIFQSQNLANQNKILVVNTQLCRKMNKNIPQNLRRIIYQELVDNLVRTYLSFYAADLSYHHVILIGDMNDPACFRSNGQGNIQLDPIVPVTWQEGAGHQPTQSPQTFINADGNKDWILFYSQNPSLTFHSSKFYCANRGEVSDHPYVKEATLNFSSD